MSEQGHGTPSVRDGVSTPSVGTSADTPGTMTSSAAHLRAPGPEHEPELLRRLVDIIVRETTPEAIVLFGSRAREDAGPDSDVDLLLYTRDEVEHWRTSRNHVVGRACREGRVLHGRL